MHRTEPAAVAVAVAVAVLDSHPCSKSHVFAGVEYVLGMRRVLVQYTIQIGHLGKARW